MASTPMLPTHDPSGAVARRRSDFLLALLAGRATLCFAWTRSQGAEWLRERFTQSDAAADLREEALAVGAAADSTIVRRGFIILGSLLAMTSTIMLVVSHIRIG